MAESRARSIATAARELCLAFPGVEEFVSHGSPNYRARLGARKGRVFAVWALNHHGDGHVALWLNTPAAGQSRLLAASRHVYKPPYVGPSGWIAVELNRGVSWTLVRELVHQAYLNSSPAQLVAQVPKPPRVPAPNRRMKPGEIDRLKSPRALRVLKVMRASCAGLPGVTEGVSMGSATWRVGKRAFAYLSDYGKGLSALFWVGIDRQGPLEMDPRLTIPPYLGHLGWMALDVSRGVNARELRDFLVESWRHFAPLRAVKAFDAEVRRQSS